MDFKKISSLLLAVLTSMSMSPVAALADVINSQAELEDYLSGASTDVGEIKSTIKTATTAMMTTEEKSLTGGELTNALNISLAAGVGENASLSLSNIRIGQINNQTSNDQPLTLRIVGDNVKLTGGLTDDANPKTIFKTVLSGNNKTNISVEGGASFTANGDVTGIVDYSQQEGSRVHITKSSIADTEGLGSFSTKFATIDGGDLTVDNNMTVSEGTYTQTGGNVNIKGSLSTVNGAEIGGGTLNVGADMDVSNGKYNQTGGNATIKGSLTAKSAEIAGITSVDGYVNVTETSRDPLTPNGYLQSAGTVTIKGSDADGNSLKSATDINLEGGTLNAHHSVKAAGDISITNGSVLNIIPGTTSSATMTNSLISEGNINISGGSIVDLGKTNYADEYNMAIAKGDIIINGATLKRAGISADGALKLYNAANLDKIGNISASNVFLGDDTDGFNGTLTADSIVSNGSYVQKGGTATIGTMNVQNDVTLDNGTLTVYSSDGNAVDYVINEGTFNLSVGDSTGVLKVNNFTNAEGSYVNLNEGTRLEAADSIILNGGYVANAPKVALTGDLVKAANNIDLRGNIIMGDTTVSAKNITIGEAGKQTIINADGQDGTLESNGNIIINKDSIVNIDSITSSRGSANLTIDNATLTANSIGAKDGDSKNSLSSYIQKGGNVKTGSLYVGGTQSSTKQDLLVEGGTLTVATDTNPQKGILSVGGNLYLTQGATLAYEGSSKESTSQLSVGGKMNIADDSKVTLSRDAVANITQLEVEKGTLTAGTGSKITTENYTQGNDATDVNVATIAVGLDDGSYNINGGKFTVNNQLTGTLATGGGSGVNYNQTGGTAKIKSINNIYDVNLSGGSTTVDNTASISHDTNVQGGNFTATGAYTTGNAFNLEKGTVTVSGNDAVLSANSYTQTGNDSYADITKLRVTNAFSVTGNGAAVDAKTQFKLRDSLNAKTVKFTNLKDANGVNAAEISGTVQATDKTGISLVGSDIHLLAGGNMSADLLTLGVGTDDATQSILYINDGASINDVDSIILNDASQVLGEGVGTDYYGSINNTNLTYSQLGKNSNTKLKTLTAGDIYLQAGTMDIQTLNANSLNIEQDAESFTLGKKATVKTASITASEEGTNVPNLILKDGSTFEATDSMSLSQRGTIDNGAGEKANATIIIGNSYQQQNDGTTVNVANIAARTAGTGNVTILGGNFDVTNLGKNAAASQNQISAFGNVTIGGDTLTPSSVKIGQVYTKNLEIKNSSSTSANVIGTVNDANNAANTTVTITGGETNFTNGVYTNDYQQSNNSQVTLNDNAFITSTGNIGLDYASLTVGNNSTITSGKDGVISINESTIQSATGDKLGTITSDASSHKLAYKQTGDSSNVKVKEIDLKRGQLIMGDQEGTSGGTITADRIAANKITVYDGTLNIGDENTAGALEANIYAYGTNVATIDIQNGTLNLYDTTLKASTDVASSYSSPVVKLAAGEINLHGDNKFGSFMEGGNVGTIYSMQIGDATPGHAQTNLNFIDNAGLQVTSGKGGVKFVNSSIVIGANGNTNNLELVTNGGNIVFERNADADTVISNGPTGTIIVDKGANHKDGTSVKFGNVNSSRQGTIINKGYVTISEALEDEESGSISKTTVYADEYTQTDNDKSKTSVERNATLDATQVTIGKGELELSAGGVVSAGRIDISKLGTVSPTISTVEYTNNQGLDAIIKSQTINVSDAIIAVKSNSNLNFTLEDPNSLGTAKGTYNNINATVDQAGQLAFIANKDGFENVISNAQIDLKAGGSSATGVAGGTLVLEGNNTVTGTTITGADKSEIKLDSTAGNITIDGTSKITTEGTLNITDSNRSTTKTNTVTINADINDTGAKKGDINKDGKNSLNIGGNVNGNNLTISEGKVTIDDNKKISMNGEIYISGSAEDEHYVDVIVGEGSKITSKGIVSLGDNPTSAEYTKVTLGKGSSITANDNVKIYADVIMNGATIESNGDNSLITVGDKSTITTGENTGESKLKADTIHISGGSTISIKSGSSLIYDGTVTSEAHYNIEQGAKQEIAPGSYVSQEYKGNGGVIKNTSSGYLDAVTGEKGNVGVLITKGSTTFADSRAAYDNTAGSVLDSGNGGAIYNGYADGDTPETAGQVVPATIEIEGGTLLFQENTADINGGAIANYGDIYVAAGNDVASNTITFQKNKAGNKKENGSGYGGAIFNSQTGDVQGTINLGKNGTISFKENTATREGGAIYNDSASDSAIILGKTSFEANQANRGGAISTKAGTITIGSNSLFQGNSTIAGDAEAAGGAIYITGTDTKIDLGSGSTFNGNTSFSNGGAIYIDNVGGGSTFDLISSVVTANTASDSGGGIYNKGTLNIKDGTSFDNNVAAKNGGAIYNDATGVLNIEKNAKFGGKEGTANRALKGGAIYNNGGEVNIANNVIFGNNEAEAGGAIYSTGNNMSLEKVTFRDNYAKYVGDSKDLKGGAIYFDNGVLSLEADTTFTNNIVGNPDDESNVPNKAQGGAIYAGDGATININGAKLTGNIAVIVDGDESEAQGGAIYIDNGAKVNLNSRSETSSSASVITENQATRGGAFYIADGGLLNLNGAKIGLDSYNATTKETTYSGNKAVNGADGVYGLGGGIYVAEGGQLKLDGGSIVGNSAESRGGAIFNASNINLGWSGMSSSGKPTGTEFIANSASDAGSAIYNQGKMVLGGGWKYSNSAHYSFEAGHKFAGNVNTSAIANSGDLILASEYGPDGAKKVSNFEFNYTAYDRNNEPENVNDGALWNESYIDEDNVRHDGVMRVLITDPASGDDEFGKFSMRISGIGKIDSETKNANVDGAALHITGDSRIHTYTESDTVFNDMQNDDQDGSKATYKDTIHTAYFTNNLGRNGGALFIDRTTGDDGKYVGAKKNGTLTLTNVKFQENQSTWNGGAIYNKGSKATDTDQVTSTIKIDNSTRFLKNFTNGDGGAINNEEGGIIELGSVVGDKNYGYTFANEGDIEGKYANVAMGGGGAIANKGKLVLYTDNTGSETMNGRSVIFTHQGSTADGEKKYTGKGGALYFSGDSEVETYYYDETLGVNKSMGSSTLGNALFEWNEATEGGALYNNSTKQALQVIGTKFNDNTALKNGGAAVTESTTWFWTDNTNNFYRNKVSGTTNEKGELDYAGYGGALFNTTDSHIKNNTIKTEADRKDTSKIVDAFVENTAANGGGGAIANTAPSDKTMTIHGGIRFKDNSARFGGAIFNQGSLALDVYDGNIEFVGNKSTAQSETDAVVKDGGSAIYMSDNATASPSLTFTAKDASGVVDKNNTNGITFTEDQTIAGGGSKTSVNVQAGHITFKSDLSNLTSMYWQDGGVVTVNNKFMNVSQGTSGTRTHSGVFDGSLVLAEGARLISDNLYVENQRPTTGETNAKIVFENNSKAQLTDLSALYKDSGLDYIVYTTLQDGDNPAESHKIHLASADVEINDESVVLSKEVEIGVNKKNNPVRDLALGGGATMASTITVNGAPSASERAARLELKDGVHTSKNAGVILNGYNSELAIANETTNVDFQASLQSKGTDAEKATQKVTKIGNGNLTFRGNELSNFTGQYIQGLDTSKGEIVETGTVRFTDSFFDKETAAKAKFYAGVLQLDEGVKFEDGTVITLNPDNTYSNPNDLYATLATSIKSTLDLTDASNPKLSFDDYNDVTVEGIEKGGKLQINDNSKVTTATDGNIYVGENFTSGTKAIKSLALGGEASKNTSGVRIITDGNAINFNVRNDNSKSGVGVLGLGETTVAIAKDADGNNVIVTPTVNLEDNTQLELNAGLNKAADERYVQVVAKGNGDIVKTGAGDITIDGDKSNFTGNLVIKNGELKVGHLDKQASLKEDEQGNLVVDSYGKIAQENGKNIVDDADKFTATTKYDLTQVEDGAVAVVKNITTSDDILVAGDIGNDGLNKQANAKARYNLTVDNTDRDGDILVGYNAATGESTGTIYVRNGQTVKMATGVGSDGVNNRVIADKLSIQDNTSTFNLASGDLSVKSLKMAANTTFDMTGGSFSKANITSDLNLTGDANFKVDLDPATGNSDKVVINPANISNNGSERNINIAAWNLISDPKSSSQIYNIFVDDTEAGNPLVAKDGSYKFTTSVSDVVTPIADYKFGSVTNAEGKTTGQYRLTRTGYSPTAYAVPVALQNAYITQLGTYDMAFSNFDTVMSLPTTVGQNRPNQYAVSDVDETIVYSPLYIPELDNGAWFRPYGNFETLKFKGGAKDVDYQSYGGFVGGDTALVQLGESPFQGSMSAYVGYTGTHQDSHGVSGTSNGGSIGVTGSIYRGNFFSGLTVNANAGIGDVSTPFGGTDFFMLGVGVASKTGYNWELGRGRFIIQPSWLMSYSFVNAFDPGTIAGYKIDADALHGVQLTPQLKFIANLPQGWQPYLLVNFRWNLADDTGVKMASTEIPDISLKSYVEYGLGMQKRWGERFTGYGQFLGRGGGRNGVGVNLGLRWAVGQGR